MNERYSRQILFPGIGKVGQQRLLDARVMLVGCGALGASHAEMLARAGVGSLRIVDRDFVEFTNLQRQTLYKEQDAVERLPKAIAAKQRIAEINSETEVEAIVADINNSNIESLIEGCDVVIDGSDNFQVRYLVNDACVKHDIPWIYGAAVSSYGSTMTILPHATPCLRCIFGEIPDAGSTPTCDTAGVIMPIISSISAIQVAEALKLIAGDRGALHGTLMQIDVWNNERRAIKLAEPDVDCVACGKGEFEFLDAEAGEFAAVLCGRDAIQIAPARAASVDLAAMSDRLASLGSVKHNEYLLRFQPSSESVEMTLFTDGRAIIKGIDDPSAARSLYARYVGT